MTLEKIDQEMYFWTQLPIASPLTFKVVLLLFFMPYLTRQIPSVSISAVLHIVSHLCGYQ